MATEGNRGMTRAEHTMLTCIKRVVEQGFEFGADRFFALILATPREDLESSDVQRIVFFLREQCDVLVEELRDFATTNSLPISSSLLHRGNSIGKTPRRAMAAGPRTSSVRDLLSRG